MISRDRSRTFKSLLISSARAGIIVFAAVSTSCGGDGVGTHNTPVVQPVAAQENVPLIQQQNTDWCWLAVTQMAIAYYHYGQSLTQAQMLDIGYHLNPGTCENAPSQCNIPGSISDIQTLLAYVGGNPSIAGNGLSADQVLRTLLHTYVIIAFINTGQAVGHFVIVRSIYPDAYGYPIIQINDPWNGSLTGYYAAFAPVWVATVIVGPSGPSKRPSSLVPHVFRDDLPSGKIQAMSPSMHDWLHEH